jgi:hypothetical protein
VPGLDHQPNYVGGYSSVPITDKPEEKPMPVATPRQDKLAKARHEAKKAQIKAASKEVSSRAYAAALTKAVTPKAMTREQARALLAHDPDYLGDITNEALVDLLDDDTVAEHHKAIRVELDVNRGLRQKAGK